MDPTPEHGGQKYDARKLIMMATNIDSFRRATPSQFDEIASFGVPPEDITTSNTAKTELDKVQKGLDRYFLEGQGRIMNKIYFPFAENKDWIRKREVVDAGPLTIKVDLGPTEIVPLGDLGKDELAEFRVYLDTSAAVNRETAVLILDDLLASVYSPSLKYTESPSLAEVKKKVDLGIKKLILNVLPDLNDHEARHFFGQLTTAKDVFDSVNSR